jgi:hypothetical protein
MPSPGSWMVVTPSLVTWTHCRDHSWYSGFFGLNRGLDDDDDVADAAAERRRKIDRRLDELVGGRS